MPLTPYKRGPVWWAKGRIQYNGLPITGYVRESTGASTEAGARQWITERQAAEERRYLLGPDEADKRDFTFADAVLEYKDATPEMAKHLVPLLTRLGRMPVDKITPQMVRDLGSELYPKNSTASWRRWVIVPVRAVINNAAALGKCHHIRVESFSKQDRINQDRKRGKQSGIRKTPGSWEWLLQFRQHAPARHRALALFMFTTGARVGQAVAMKPHHLKRLDEGYATIPGAKGHDDREVRLLPELVEELKALKPSYPRGWDHKPANLRVFGFADKDSPRRGWRTACALAGIAYLPPHSAGRHGFGQEMRVRQGVDVKAVEAVGGWSEQGGMVDRTYTHAEDSDAKILDALRTGRVQAENTTGLKLAEMLGK